MKRLFLLFTILCTAIMARAEDKSLFITFNDGSKAEFSLTQNPSITIADDLLTVEAGGSTLTYELWRVSKFTFGTSTAIRDVKSDYIKGDNIRVYTLDGKVVSVPVSQGEFNLDGLSKGIYIVNINGNTFKITKR